MKFDILDNTSKVHYSSKYLRTSKTPMSTQASSTPPLSFPVDASSSPDLHTSTYSEIREQTSDENIIALHHFGALGVMKVHRRNIFTKYHRVITRPFSTTRYIMISLLHDEENYLFSC